MGWSEAKSGRQGRLATAIGFRIGQGWILTAVAVETGLLAAGIASGKIPSVVLSLFRALLTL